MREKKYSTEQVCNYCGHSLFRYLSGVYRDGSDEIVCLKCNGGIKIKTIGKMEETDSRRIKLDLTYKQAATILNAIESEIERYKKKIADLNGTGLENEIGEYFKRRIAYLESIKAEIFKAEN